MTADAVVAAGRDLTLQASANAAGGHSVSRIDAGGDLALVAGRDLTLQASQLTAGDNVVLQAGQDLRLEALADTRLFDSRRSSGSTTTHQVADIRAGGDVALSAGRDALLQGSRVDAEGALALVAGRDIDIQAVVDERSSEREGAVHRGSYQRSQFDQTVRGAELTAGSDIAIVGGRDVTLEAAYVGSDAGGVAIGAGRDLSLIAAEEQHNFEQTTQTKKSGLFSSKRTTTYDRVDETLAIGTTISGETVDLSAGRDMALIAAQVAGTGDVSLAAGRDLLIGGAQETYSATHDTQTTKSGLFGSGGIGVTWGTRETRNTADIEETTHIGSLIGSSAGRVDILAGGDVAIVGSDVLSKAGIGISGENVAIVAADSTMSVEERQTMRQSGLNISLSGGVIDTAMAVYGAARRASEVDDDRLAVLYAAQAGQTFAGAGNMASDASGQFAALGQTNTSTEGGGGSSGINLRIGYGASSSESTSELKQNVHTGSRIGSEGDVSIIARSGDLAVVGSTINGDNVALLAANDILLRSSQDVSTHTSRSESQSGEVGITIGTEAGIGVYVAAAMAKGRGDGSGLVHNETVVTAANGLTFVSGNDTTLQGAQLMGDTVTGRVGGDFTLVSEQDADHFDRKDTAVSGSAAIGFGGGSANIAFSQSKVNSDYRSVREQAGVQAGSGGFDIEVGGHTQLDGAALASTSPNNRLSTGTLGWSDLENRAEYSASSISFSAGTSGNSSGSSGSFSPGLSLPQSDSASSTTRAGIAAGTIEVRDAVVDLSGLNRDVTALQQEGLKTIFDERKVAERMEMGQVAGEVGFAVAKDIVESGKNKAAADLLRAGQDAAAAEAAGDEEAFAAAKARASQANAVLQSWGDGGTRKQATQMLTGALVAGLGGGNALAGAAGVFVNEQALSSFSAFLNGKGFDNDGLAHSALMAAGGLALGATGGALLGDAGSGAVAGSTAQQHGYFDYRDGRRQTGDLLRGLLEEFAQTDPDAARGMQQVVDRAITAGGDPDAIAAVLLMPGGLKTLQDIAVAETAALKRHGRSFESLSPSAQRDLLVGLYRAGLVTVHPGTVVASEGGAEVPMGQTTSGAGVTTTPEADPTLRTQVGTVISGVVVSGGRGVEKAVNWMGEDVAMGASFLLMSALGRPAKAAGSMLFHASPAGEWTQGVKDEYAVVPLAEFFGRYGFGAMTDEALLAVNPASHAMSSVTVDTLLSSFGIVAGRTAAKGILDNSRGFGEKVNAADAVPLEKTLVIPENKSEFLDAYRQAAQEGSLVRTDPTTVRGSGFRQRLEQEQGPPPAKGYDADHVVEICVGGKDCAISNGQWLESSRNRSAGSQIGRQVKDDPIGTRYTDVIVEGGGLER